MKLVFKKSIDQTADRHVLRLEWQLKCGMKINSFWIFLHLDWWINVVGTAYRDTEHQWRRKIQKEFIFIATQDVKHAHRDIQEQDTPLQRHLNDSSEQEFDSWRACRCRHVLKSTTFLMEIFWQKKFRINFAPPSMVRL